jgi:aspartokinase/homoserine dehydrogenase 1
MTVTTNRSDDVDEITAAVCPDISVFVVGLGRVGRALIEQITAESEGVSQRLGLRLRIAGAANSRRQLIRSGGIPGASLMHSLDSSGSRSSLPELSQAAVESLKGASRGCAVFVDCTDSEDTVEFYAPLLDAGVHVVSANKRPFGGDLGTYRRIKIGNRAGRGALLHETTVGAALPLVGTLTELVNIGDRVRRIEGAVSGTLGFLMTKVAEGVAFSVALQEARDYGYTEPNPREDLSGQDVARKIMILAREGGLPIEASSVRRESLLPTAEWDVMSLDEFWRRVPELDASIEARAQAASVEDGRLSYLASVVDGRVDVGLRRVEPGSPFTSLRGTDNMVAIWTDLYSESPLVIRGPVGGPHITASGLFTDILKAARFNVWMP